jgi:ornithine carbamoyltransferase
VLADILTIRQRLGTHEGKKIAWIGDGNNVANSWLDAAYMLGFDLALACPEGYDPDAKLLARAKEHANVTLHRDPREAAAGANAVNTDVWASMGKEEEKTSREKAFAGFTVDAKLMSAAEPDAIFLHCLPAHRGEEVAAEVIDGPQSVVWDEAENRLHIQKALLAVLMGGERIG